MTFYKICDDCCDDWWRPVDDPVDLCWWSIDNAYNNLLYRITAINDNDEIVNSLLDLKSEAMNSTTPQDLYDILRRSFQVLNDNNL